MDENELKEIKETKTLEELDEETEVAVEPKIEGTRIPVGFIIFFSVLAVAIIATIIVLFVLGGPLSKNELEVISSAGSI